MGKKGNGEGFAGVALAGRRDERALSPPAAAHRALCAGSDVTSEGHVLLEKGVRQLLFNSWPGAASPTG